MGSKGENRHVEVVSQANSLYVDSRVLATHVYTVTYSDGVSLHTPGVRHFRRSGRQSRQWFVEAVGS